MLNLRKNPKEIAENTMIVDMVRNNFYRFCEPESVVVYRWGAVHTYPGVHHLVSGVSGQKRSGVDLIEGIQAIFPAASMTGAPQQAAQRFIEQYEPIARGIYSGALGYLTPESEGDFAMVIRSWVYDTRSKKLLLQVGSGITYDSQPRAEWEETLLKAHRHIQSLGLTTPLITP
jgi:para-aminobenzoate synthetase component 1